MLTKKCLKCFVEKPISDFSPRKKGILGVNTQCKECCCQDQKSRYARNPEKYKEASRRYRKNHPDTYRKNEKKYRDAHPERKMLDGAYFRSKIRGWECNLTQEDIVIPEICPILGIEIKFSRGKVADFSPSLDRKDQSLGYIKGNIQVISHKANRIKGHLTKQEIKKLYEYTFSTG